MNVFKDTADKISCVIIEVCNSVSSVFRGGKPMAPINNEQLLAPIDNIQPMASMLNVKWGKRVISIDFQIQNATGNDVLSFLLVRIEYKSNIPKRCSECALKRQIFGNNFGPIKKTFAYDPQMFVCF